MATNLLKIYKETALPGTLTANSIYLVAPASDPDYVEMYVTGTLATTVKRIINKADIQAMINAAVVGSSSLQVVDDIAARNALTPTSNILVLVKNATADPTVASGAATYVYEVATTTWTKVSEFESLDVVLQWNNIQGKPTSSPAQIDSAVANSHTHTNKTQLDKISEDGSGYMTYNGQYQPAGLETQSW